MTQIAQDSLLHDAATPPSHAQPDMRRLEELLEQVQQFADPVSRDVTGQIVQTMMEYHGAGLAKILERVADAGQLGHAIINDLAQDDLVSSLLLLYGLHPLDLNVRVRLALEKVRPYLASHGGNVALTRIGDNGAVHLQMEGSCHGCPSSSATMKNTIEQAIYDLAPDVTSIQVEGVEAPAKPAAGATDGFVPLGQLTSRNGKRSLQGNHHDAK